MKRLHQTIIGLLVVTGLTMGSVQGRTKTNTKMIFLNQPVVMHITAPKPEQAGAARQACWQELKGIENHFSSTIQGSRVNQLNQYAARKPVVVDHKTMQLLTWAKSLAGLSQGHFDVTTAAYLWHYGFGQGVYHVPGQLALDQLKPLVGSRLIMLDQKDQVVLFKRSGVQVTLDPLLVNYAFVRLNDVLKKNHVRSAAITIGQNLLAFGSPPKAGAWQHQLHATWKPAQLLPTLAVAKGQVLVADTYSNSFEEDGHHYHEVVNPLTGQPYDYSKMAVLYSPSLKKVAIIPAVLLAEKPEAAVALVDKTPGLACLIVDARNKLIQSKRWPSDWQIRH